MTWQPTESSLSYVPKNRRAFKHQRKVYAIFTKCPKKLVRLENALYAELGMWLQGAYDTPYEFNN